MPSIPAVCDRCGHIFPSGFGLRGNARLTLSGVGTICPRCGANARMPDGVYEVTSDTLTRLGTVSPDRLKILLAFARRLQHEHTTVEAVRAEIAASAPELQSWADVLPKTRSDLYAFLGLLVSILMAVIALAALRNDNSGSVTVNNVTNITVDQVFDHMYRHQLQGADSSAPILAVPRNDPCPCGSGKKYKKCHGAPPKPESRNEP